MNFAARANAPALYSVALMDDDLPAVDGFRVLQPLRGPKEITVYPYNGHEGGQAHHMPAAFSFAASVTK